MTLREALQKAQAARVSPIIGERTKLSTEEIIGLELTVNAVDLTEKDGETFAIVTFDELPTGFYFGGKVLTDIVCNVYEILGHNLTDAITLADDEKFKVKASKQKSKSGRFYTAFEII